MPKIPMNTGGSRKRMVNAVKIHFRELRKTLDPQLRAFDSDGMRNVQVAQNILRDCLTAVFIEMTPYRHREAIELAQRAASYALSTVPMEDQEAVVASFLEDFADVHMLRTSSGAIISSGWQMVDGTEKTNFPEN